MKKKTKQKQCDSPGVFIRAVGGWESSDIKA